MKSIAVYPHRGQKIIVPKGTVVEETQFYNPFLYNTIELMKGLSDTTKGKIIEELGSNCYDDESRLEFVAELEQKLIEEGVSYE